MSERMDADTDSSLELRVLYGPQAGSSLPLAPGEYLLGTSDDCAILLAGPHMKEHHALLTIDERGAVLKPVDGAVCDAMGHEITDELVLTSGLPVELGGVSIAVDGVDARWPTPQSVAPMANAATATEDTEAQAAAAASEPEPAANKWAAVGSEVLQRLKVASKPLRRLGLGLAGAAGLTTLAFALAGWVEGEAAAPLAPNISADATAPAPTEPAADAPPRALSDLITQINASKALNVTRREDGRWLVAGYVRTAALRQSLLDSLQGLSPPAELNVYAEDELIAAAAQALNSRDDLNDAWLQIESSGEGTLHLVGAAHRAQQVDAAKAALLAEVAGVRQVDSAVLFPGQLLANLKEQIRAAGLAERVAFAKESPEVVLKGKLNADELERWNTLYAAFVEAYGDVLPVDASLDDTPVPTRRAGVGVKTIVGGAVPYVVTDTGVRVNRGGDFNGHKLTAVQDAEVVFEGSERLRIGR